MGSVFTVLALFCACALTSLAAPPGVVLDYLPAESGQYVGSPAIAVLPNGDYVASHDHFGPKTPKLGGKLTSVFRSTDRGQTWSKSSEVQGMYWATLFVHRDALYLLGTHSGPGNIVICRSRDGGRTWTEPKDKNSGVLFAGFYHCAPVPVVAHAGHLWRAFESVVGLRSQWKALVISATEDADLLQAANWRMSEPYAHLWSQSQWIEGNVVVTPEGKLVNILRTGGAPDKAAIVHISDDGRKLTHDRERDLIDFPGGGSKFTIRFDPQTKRYWSLANKQSDPPAGRNVLALTSSANLREWKVEAILLQHADRKFHAWQYVDWLFEGADIIAVSRTAWDGSHNFHDANYLTFHRFANFRALKMTEAAPPVKERVDVTAADLKISGTGFTIAKLENGGQAFANRKYQWQQVPEKFRGWSYTRTSGGEPAEICVQAVRNTTVFAATAAGKQAELNLAVWRAVANADFHYTDKGKTPMKVFCQRLKAGESLTVPQGNWAGLLVLVPPAGTALEAFVATAQPLTRLKYNHPGLTVDLGVGLWAFPLPMDFNGDGLLDLPVSCPDKPYNGLYVFENPGADTAKNPLPVFKTARHISRGLQMAQVSFVNGQPRVTTPAMAYPEFLAAGLEQGIKLPLTNNVHANKVRGNFWRYVDFDGDSKLDLVVGADDWTDYGWDNAYTAQGVWTNGPLRGFVYILRNTGTNEKPVYDKPVLVNAGDKPVETFGWPSPCFADFRGTGKLDLICGEFRDSFTFFENSGTRTQPKYAPGRQLKLANGQPLTMDLEMITPVALDWNRDGHVDLICGDEDGRVAFIENTGRLAADGAPQFLPPRYFQQEADEVKCGALATPVGVDWDGDGAMDIISGNSAGYILFYKNLSGPGVEQPKWAAPEYLKADGQVIRFMAGPNGSIQGPCEAKWGYTTVSLADWDGDGLPDILANSILGKVVWFRNLGMKPTQHSTTPALRHSSPLLAAAQPVEVEWDGPQPALAYGWLRPEGKALLTQWRTTPFAVDWNKDRLTDLVMLDQNGYLAFFERAQRDGKLVLLPPRRVLCDEKGEPLRPNAKLAGKSGRRKICITDWDGDGKLDILLNAANARFLRQVDARDGKWFFKDMGLLVAQNIEGHDVSPTVVDFNGDGVPDFLGGAEDGHFYYLKNPRAK